jgi:hypothetical protein
MASLIAVGCAAIILAVFFDGYRAWLFGIGAAVLTGALIPAGIYLGSQLLQRAIPQVPVSVVAEFADAYTIRLFIQATVPKTVVLQRLRAEAVQRGDHYPDHTGPFGGITPRPFDVFLDVDPPIVRPNAAAEGARDFPFTVSDSDVEVLDLLPHVRYNTFVHWFFLLDWTCAGGQGTIRIGFNDNPFAWAEP